MQGVVISACNLTRQQAEAEELSVHASSGYIGRPCLSHSLRKGRRQGPISGGGWCQDGKGILAYVINMSSFWLEEGPH